MNPLTVDCDTGRDDAVALLSALTLKLPIVGVTASYGNAPLDRTLDNTARVLALAGRGDITLFAGAARPARNHAGYENVTLPRQKTAGNGLCDIILPPAARPLPQTLSAAAMAEAVRAMAGKYGRLDHVILSPATHCAGLIAELGDDAANIFGTITMMGGKFDTVWAESPGADFNVACDPFAVHAILARGFKIRFVPMDTAWPVTLTLDDIDALIPRTPCAHIVRDLMIAHVRHFSPTPLFRMVDPCVMLALTQPACFTPATLIVNLDEESPDFGRLVETPDGFPAEIYRADSALQRTFLDRILESLDLERE